MTRYTVKISNRFWQTAKALRSKYTHEQFAEIISVIRDCINELAEKGFIEENGWDDHMLIRPPFSDGCHYEFHIYDNDILVVYFRRERNRVIRMVGVYDHATIPGNR
ncbi:hypothetical protein [Adlercreutzia sp. ZJ141]|uniref:hypothetical protein n=1 Tax=Adlercreutzia sp. ZJ141 TaxID=2709406 RepID=UPI0013EAAA17|nr:hypothetical protein [Adlercreutzia sp. ZJ141]